MASAAVKFTQGVSVGSPGVSLFGSTGTAVVVENGSVAANYTFEVRDTPAGSAVATGTVQDGASPSYSFTPDVPGGYLVRITVRDSAGNTATDERQFGVKEPSGRFIPSFKSRGLANNFLSQLRGWAPYLEKWLRLIDGISPKIVATSGTIDDQSSTQSGEAAYSIRFTSAATLDGLTDGWEGRPLNLLFPAGGTIANEAGGSTAANRILTGTGADLAVAANGAVRCLYDDGRWRVQGAAGGGSVGGSTTQVLFNNDGSEAGTPYLRRIDEDEDTYDTDARDEGDYAEQILHRGAPVFDVDFNEFAAEGAADGSLGFTRTFTWRLKTTDDTPGNLGGSRRIYVPAAFDDCFIRVIVEQSVAFDGGGGATMHRASFRRNGGTLAIVGSVKDYTDADDWVGGAVPVGVGVAISVVDNTRLKIVNTGIDATDIGWTGSVHVIVSQEP